MGVNIRARARLMVCRCHSLNPAFADYAHPIVVTPAGLAGQGNIRPVRPLPSSGPRQDVLHDTSPRFPGAVEESIGHHRLNDPTPRLTSMARQFGRR